LNVFETARSFIRQAIRVLRVSYQPKPEEFSMTAKITGLGLVLLGTIGYIITIVFNFI